MVIIRKIANVENLHYYILTAAKCTKDMRIYSQLAAAAGGCPDLVLAIYYSIFLPMNNFSLYLEIILSQST